MTVYWQQAAVTKALTEGKALMGAARWESEQEERAATERTKVASDLKRLQLHALRKLRHGGTEPIAARMPVKAGGRKQNHHAKAH